MNPGRSRKERDARLSSEVLHTFSFPEIVARLREEPEYAESGRNGVTLVKSADLRVLLEVLRRGAGLAEHRAPGPITVQVVEGELRFAAGDEVVYLKPGELLALTGGQLHSVAAVHDTAFLLTIAPAAKPEPQP